MIQTAVQEFKKYLEIIRKNTEKINPLTCEVYKEQILGEVNDAEKYLQALEHIQQPEDSIKEKINHINNLIKNGSSDIPNEYLEKFKTFLQPIPTKHIQPTEDRSELIKAYRDAIELWGKTPMPIEHAIRYKEAKAKLKKLEEEQQSQPTEEKLMVQTAERKLNYKEQHEILKPIIDKHLGWHPTELRMASAKYFVESGSVSGGLFIAIREIANEYHAQFAAEQRVSLSKLNFDNITLDIINILDESNGHGGGAWNIVEYIKHLPISLSNDKNTNRKCECGNILTEKEVFYETCLQCDKTI